MDAGLLLRRYLLPRRRERLYYWREMASKVSAGGAGRVSPSREIMAVMMPIPGVEIGEGSRRICAAVSAPGFAESHPEEFDIFVEIARYRPMTEDAYFRQLAACRGHDVSQQL